MPDEYIIEMCCDWSSVGAENGNSPQSWFAKNKDVKWKFSDEQEKLIWETTEALWPGGRKATAEFKHDERYFNDKLWEILNDVWKKENDIEILREQFDYNNLENIISLLSNEKKEATEVIGKMKERGYEPTVNLKGVGSLQALSFIFSPTVTNYVMNLLDSILDGNYSRLVDDKVLQGIGLGNIELGGKFETKSKITSNFADGILRSLNIVNSSKLKSKLLLVNRFVSNLKKYGKTISDKIERQEYMDDVKAFMKVISIIKNVIENRSNFVNVLKKTLLLQEGSEELTSEQFYNIYDGI